MTVFNLLRERDNKENDKSYYIFNNNTAIIRLHKDTNKITKQGMQHSTLIYYHSLVLVQLLLFFLYIVCFLRNFSLCKIISGYMLERFQPLLVISITQLRLWNSRKMSFFSHHGLWCLECVDDAICVLLTAYVRPLEALYKLILCVY